METKKHLWITTVIAVGIYLLAILLSVSLILYGIYQHRIEIFRAGNKLVYLWMLNPIPLILSVFGLIHDRERRRRYWTVILLASLAWIGGGVLIARYF